MDSFTDLHEKSIDGVISTFDRLMFKGHLNALFPDATLKRCLWQRGVLLRDAGKFFEAKTRRIKDHVASIAERSGRPFDYLTAAHTHASGSSKESVARAIAARDGVTDGLVCVLSVLEPCTSFAVVGKRATHRQGQEQPPLPSHPPRRQSHVDGRALPSPGRPGRVRRRVKRPRACQFLKGNSIMQLEKPRGLFRGRGSTHDLGQGVQGA